jgi:hypothetical protein
MMRKVLMVLGGMSILASMVVFTGGSAFANPIAYGFGSCKFSAGKGTFSPPLTPAGSASVNVEKITFTVSPSADCGSVVTSPSGTSINTLTSVTGTGTYVHSGFANSCTALNADNVGTIKVKTKWGAAPPIAPTKATFAGNVGTITNSGPIRDITLTTPTVVTGSFGPGNTGGTVALATSIPVACPPVVTTFKITGSYTDYSN